PYVSDRHHSLRTAVGCQGLERPQLVVWRNAELTVQANEFEAEDPESTVIDRLQPQFDARHQRLDLTQAPYKRLEHPH
ncbi:hypothetical protein ABFV48_27155, partial [Pseudomonas syringae]